MTRMTREEAIAELSVIWERLSHPEDCENGCYSFRDGDYLEALDMAIEVLSADAVEVVRCNDCRWWNGNIETMHNDHLCRNWSKFGSISTSADDFCSYGERRKP